MIHLVSIALGFMGSNYRNKFVGFHETFTEFVPIDIGASSSLVELDCCLHFSSLIIDGIGPHQIAEKARCWNFSKSVKFFNFVKLHNNISIYIDELW